MKNIFKSLRLATFVLAASASVMAAQAGPVRNVVLVHGAFVDGSGWKAVNDILTRDGYHISLAQPPETSLEDDVLATTRVIDRQDGPTILVGHSYGGVIVTEAGNNAKVKALVYVAAFQPDAGESLATLKSRYPAVSNNGIVTLDKFIFVDPAKFHADFGADLPLSVTDFMAKSQVPLSVKSATTPVQHPAWKTRPSFAILSTQDHTINPDLQRYMYERSGSTLTDIAASHAVYMSQPEAVAALD